VKERAWSAGLPSSAEKNQLIIFFLRFFGVKLGYFIINEVFPYATNMKVYQQKTEKFFVSEEKTFYRIGYWLIQLMRVNTVNIFKFFTKRYI
jgi:hypothetical protein